MPASSAYGQPLPGYQVPGSQLELWHPRPGLVVERARGQATGAAVAHLTGELDRVLARDGRILIFGDWSGIAGYDAGARQTLMRWTQDRQQALLGIHLLVDSPIIALAVQVASLATRGMTRAYSSHTTWSVALGAEMMRAVA